MFAVSDNLIMISCVFSSFFLIQIETYFGYQLRPTGDVKCVCKQQCVGDMRF